MPSDNKEMETGSEKEPQRGAGLIQQLWAGRIQNQHKQHRLSADARRLFFEFLTETHKLASNLSEHEAALAALWPEQVLKVALILHACSEECEERSTSAGALDLAIRWMREFGKEQFLVSKETVPGKSGENGVETELRRMVHKVSVRGPLRIRDLFRSYNRRSYEELEPILALGVQRGLLSKTESGFIHLTGNSSRN